MDIGKSKRFKPIIIIPIFQLALVFLIHGIVTGNEQPETRPAAYPSERGNGLSNCRFGTSVSDLSEVNWLDDLGAGWYFNFSYSMDPAPNSAEYVALVSISQHKTADGEYLPTYAVNPPMTDHQLGQLVLDRPGSLWVIGNEVDRGPDPGEIDGGQGDVFPEVYAQGYHDIYNFIKQKDPTAQIANSALVQVTPGRLQYLDLMWDAYLAEFGEPMPVDVWNMHLYILPEVRPNGEPNAVANIALGTDPALGRKESGGSAALCPQEQVYCVAEHDDLDVFAEQIIAMRTWMKDHDQQNKPLILSEFSILYPYRLNDGTCTIKDEFGNCFTPQRVRDFLNSSFDYLYTTTDPNLGYPKDGNRLVQQSLWFSVNNQGGVGNASDLVRDGALTLAGQAFQTYVENLSATVNLYEDGVNSPMVDTGGNSTASVTLTVDIRNEGNIPPNNTFYVTFYKNEALTQPIGTATVLKPGPGNSGMTGCSRQVRTAAITWSNLSPGFYPFWVKIDSTNGVSETNENDNIGSGLVIVNGTQNYLPVTIRK